VLNATHEATNNREERSNRTRGRGKFREEVEDNSSTKPTSTVSSAISLCIFSMNALIVRSRQIMLRWLMKMKFSSWHMRSIQEMKVKDDIMTLVVTTICQEIRHGSSTWKKNVPR